VSATVYFLPGALEAQTKAREAAGATLPRGGTSKRKARTNPNPVYAAYDNDPDAALRLVLLQQIKLNLGLPMKAEDFAFLRRYGHLAP
jgi:hypothetical protein